MTHAARRAKAKLIESFPDKVRNTAMQAMERFRIAADSVPDDPCIAALAHAVRGRHIVRINASGGQPQIIYPTALHLSGDGWHVIDACSDGPIALRDCGDINISAHRFASS
jgi:hypothetical protein